MSRDIGSGSRGKRQMLSPEHYSAETIVNDVIQRAWIAGEEANVGYLHRATRVIDALREVPATILLEALYGEPSRRSVGGVGK